MAEGKRFVYVLRNLDQNPKFYVGLSSDVARDWLTTTQDVVRIPNRAALGRYTSS